MPLELVGHEREGIEVLVLSGILVFGTEVLALRNEIELLITSAKVQVLLDLTNVSLLDATGLGTIRFARDTLREAGGMLAVFSSNPLQTESLVEAEFASVLEMFPTEQDGINSFFPERAVKQYDILEFAESLTPKPPNA
ncbi:MAG: STAS domain-containing protein [Bryobacteraceae bacterium]